MIFHDDRHDVLHGADAEVRLRDLGEVEVVHLPGKDRLVEGPLGEGYLKPGVSARDRGLGTNAGGEGQARG